VSGMPSGRLGINVYDLILLPGLRSDALQYCTDSRSHLIVAEAGVSVAWAFIVLRGIIPRRTKKTFSR
jgi:hypothetical protein